MAPGPPIVVVLFMLPDLDIDPPPEPEQAAGMLTTAAINMRLIIFGLRHECLPFLVLCSRVHYWSCSAGEPDLPTATRSCISRLCAIPRVFDH
jgi:hypothetical protein